jgi:hypothetical protein
MSFAAYFNCATEMLRSSALLLISIAQQAPIERSGMQVGWQAESWGVAKVGLYIG